MKKYTAAALALCVTLFFCGESAVADFHPGPMLIGRLAAKKLKKMREQDDFDGADSNKDGKLDKSETTKAKETHGLELDDETFKKIDKNGDGMLSHEECEQFHKESEENAKSSSKDESKTDSSVKNSSKSDSKSEKTGRPKVLRTLINSIKGE